MLGQRYPGIAGMPEDEPREDSNLWRVRYTYLGREYSTVVEADSQADAEESFKRENPHVKTVQD